MGVPGTHVVGSAWNTKNETRGIGYEVTPYISVYSTIFEHKYPQVVVDDDIRTGIQEHKYV